jgi:peroxiredoxin
MIPATPRRDDLDAITASVPVPITERLDAYLAQLADSGVAVGLAVGDAAPDFTLPSATGALINLRELLARGPVVLTFYRGEWCPYCNLQLRRLQADLPLFREAGATLVAISPQAPDNSLTMCEKHSLEFPVLSDADQRVIAAYKVQFEVDGDLRELQVDVFNSDPRAHNADGSFNLPVPATFVIGADGTIAARFVSADFRTRVEPTDVLAALGMLVS